MCLYIRFGIVGQSGLLNDVLMNFSELKAMWNFNSHEVIFVNDKLSTLIFLLHAMKTCGFRTLAANEKLKQDRHTQVAYAMQALSVLYIK